MDGEQSPAVRIQKELLEEAVRPKASDIHMEPSEKKSKSATGSTAGLETGRGFPDRSWISGLPLQNQLQFGYQ